MKKRKGKKRSKKTVGDNINTSLKRIAEGKKRLDYLLSGGKWW